jgi:hypothetical protein
VLRKGQRDRAAGVLRQEGREVVPGAVNVRDAGTSSGGRG